MLEAGVWSEVAEDFETWIRANCETARMRFAKNEWRNIQFGPHPFSPSEEEVIRVRQSIKWKVLGNAGDGKHIIEVENTGSLILPILTIGARSRDRRLNGKVFLAIGGWGSGQSRVLHVDCYRDLVPPQDLELSSLPDPEPADRLRYSNRRAEEMALGPVSNLYGIAVRCSRSCRSVHRKAGKEANTICRTAGCRRDEQQPCRADRLGAGPHSSG
jgi:hypothetical protein